MRFLKRCILFYLGGACYFILELLWRGRSHGSMFLLGGLCFHLLGWLDRGFRWMRMTAKVFVGTVMITVLELITGLVANRDHRIWDYRQLPFQYRGQISLLFSLLWMPLAGMLLYRGAETVIRAYFLPSAAK